MRRKEWTAVVVGLGVLGLTACPPAEREEEAVEEQPPAAAPPAAPAPPAGALPEGVTPEMVAQGQQLFTGKGNCYTCHGMDGRGSSLAPNLTDGQWLNVNPQQPLMPQIEQLIRTGVPQPKQYPAPMPPMGGVQLTDDEIRALAAYVVSLSAGAQPGAQPSQ